MCGKLVHSFFWALPALVLGACGPSEVAEGPELAEGAQAVLYPPPAPASGNVVDSTAFLGPLNLNSAVQAQFTTQPQDLSDCADYVVAPYARDYHNVYVVLFPQSYRVAVFQHITHEIQAQEPTLRSVCLRGSGTSISSVSWA